MSIFESEKAIKEGAENLLNNLRDRVLGIDPVAFCERNLTLDGQPFRLNGNGYKPFADIYRNIAIKAVEPGGKPIVLVKGRQVGATTMAAAIEAYFMACGMYGTNGRAPMRLMHLFPSLAMATAYSKAKLSSIISTSKPVPGMMKKDGTLKSFLECKLDNSNPSNNSQLFKQFLGGNQLWIESVGLDGDRVRGRQLALDTELPTPTGFIQLKNLKEGDKLFDENGKICHVTKLHPIQQTPEAYKVTFDDGTIVEACAEHLWLTWTRRDRINNRKFLAGKIKKPPKPTIKNTKEILETFWIQNKRNHSIPNCLPVQYSEKKQLIDPYLFGLWLGDGDRSGLIETAEPEVLNGFDYHIIPSSIGHYGSFSSKPSKSSAYRVKGLTAKLTKIGVISNPQDRRKGFYNKHIPIDYLHGSFEQRLSLLQGLMDSDGCCYKDGRCEFTQVRKKLVFQVLELIRSLGIKARIKKRESWRYNKKYNDKYRILFITKLPVFRLERKLKNLKKDNKHITKITHKFIKSIEPIETKPMRCITVDSPSHLYLITRSFIPTHNTVDCSLFDECFPYNQHIRTEKGKSKIGRLYADFKAGKTVPKVLTFNEKTNEFEYKKITNAWKRGERELIQIICGNREIKVTPNHKFLTENGWKRADELVSGDLLKATNPSFIPVKEIKNINEKDVVYDIEVEDNHNFIITSVSSSKNSGGIVAHNCQDMSRDAIGTTIKTLAQAKYGNPNDGVQVYFGTPKAKGGVYWEMWQSSNQQYFHLKCEKCGDFFPLYRPDVNWEDIWLYGFIVRCTHCSYEQDKRIAAENGRWIAQREEEESEMFGYHINQLYIPTFDKETILKAKPERNPINSEKLYMNEVLGEFYDGEGGTLTRDELQTKCGDVNMSMVSSIVSNEKRIYAGFDWGQKSALDQLSGRKQQGQSYSCGIILSADGPRLFSIKFATRFKHTDPKYKEETVNEMLRRYRINLAVGDIGDAYDLSHILQTAHGERFLVSRAVPKVNGHIKFDKDIFPKEIKFERDYYISELIGLLKDGCIKFPFKDKSYEAIEWLVRHCTSMEIKITRNKSGDPIKHYVKGSSPNDGFMALLNAYIAWKFDVTQGFKIRQPQLMKYERATSNSTVQAVLGYMPNNSGV